MPQVRPQRLSAPSDIRHIRPYKVFALVDTPPARRIVQMQIPPRRGAGGVTVLETCLLLAASQIVNARRVFEFGTFLGSTTLNLALNIPCDGEVLTLDLDAKFANQVFQHPADSALTAVHLGAHALDFVGSSVADKITTLAGNSVNFDFSQWKDSIDFVFIDGGHDLATVKSDTENALAIVDKGKPSCILWHDYGNPDYADLSKYLDKLSGQMPLFHIEDTRLCLWFNDPHKMIQPRLQ
jgi:hypothetical protein